MPMGMFSVSSGNGSRDLTARYEIAPPVSITDINGITWGDKVLPYVEPIIANPNVPSC